MCCQSSVSAALTLPSIKPNAGSPVLCLEEFQALLPYFQTQFEKFIETQTLAWKLCTKPVFNI